MRSLMDELAENFGPCMDKDDIHERIETLKEQLCKKGLYKYVHDGKIIYIGRSYTSILARVKAHESERKFQPYLERSQLYFLQLDTDAQITAAEAMLIEKYKPILNVQYKTDAPPLFDIEQFLPYWKPWDEIVLAQIELRTLQRREYEIAQKEIEEKTKLFIKNMSKEEKARYDGMLPLFCPIDDDDGIVCYRPNNAPKDIVANSSLKKIAIQKGLHPKNGCKTYSGYTGECKNTYYSMTDFEPIKRKHKFKDLSPFLPCHKEESINFLRIYETLPTESNTCRIGLSNPYTPSLPCRLEYYDEKSGYIYQMGAHERAGKTLRFYMYEPRTTEDGRKITAQMALEQTLKRCISRLEKMSLDDLTSLYITEKSLCSFNHWKDNLESIILLMKENKRKEMSA